MFVRVLLFRSIKTLLNLSSVCSYLNRTLVTFLCKQQLESD